MVVYQYGLMKSRMKRLFAIKNVFKMKIAHKTTWDSVSITGRSIVFLKSYIHGSKEKYELSKTLYLNTIFNHTGVDQAAVI